MSFPDTLPIPLHAQTREHEHAWIVESRHATSDGTVLYVRCAACAGRRVDLQQHPQVPPSALSAELRTP